jgi:glycosyltransferase involved in cell wall biosynthesis
MKIAHIFWTFTVGGAEEMVLDIIKNQNKNNFYQLIIINKLYDKILIDKLPKNVELTLIDRKPQSYNIYKFLKFWFIIKFSTANIVHCHNYHTIKFLKFIYKPICLTIHDVSFPSKYFSKYTKLFAISKSVQNYVEEESGLTSTLVYNGIETSRIKVKVNYKFDKFKIIQISRLDHKKKGQDVLINAIDILVNKIKLKNFNLSLVGEGDSYNYLKNLIKEKGLEKFISLTGKLKREEIYSSLADYNLLVQPSIWEGFGLTVVEGMVAGVPVLVSDVDGPLEIINNGKYGTSFYHEDPLDCAKKINFIYENYHMMCDTIKINNIRNYTINNFDILRVATQYEEEYSRLLEN